MNSAVCSTQTHSAAFLDSHSNTHATYWACPSFICTPHACIITHRMHRLHSKTGACRTAHFDVLVTAACTQVPYYTLIENQERYGDDIVYPSGLTMTQIAAKCDSLCNCASFNSIGWIKGSAAPLSSAQGVCFYVRTVWPTSCGIVGLPPPSPGQSVVSP